MVTAPVIASNRRLLAFTVALSALLLTFAVVNWDRQLVEVSLIEGPKAVDGQTQSAVDMPLVETAELEAKDAMESGQDAVQPKLGDPGSPEYRGITGRFMLPTGEPAAEVRVSLLGWLLNEKALRESGTSKSWKNIQCVSDSEGRFALKFEPPPGYQFALEARLDGFAALEWRWRSLPSQGPTSIGAVTLEAAGSIRGLVLDALGNAAPTDCVVYADSFYRVPGDAGRNTRLSSRVNPSSSEFLIDALPGATARLSAHAQSIGWIEGPLVTVIPGQEVIADIVYK